MLRDVVRAFARRRVSAWARERQHGPFESKQTYGRKRLLSSRLGLGCAVIFGVGGAVIYMVFDDRGDASGTEARTKTLYQTSIFKSLAGSFPVKQYLRADSPKSSGNTFHDAISQHADKEASKSTKSKDLSWFPGWTALGDKVTDAIIPDWATTLPLFIKKLQYELSFEDGSLADEMWKDAHDARMHPEIEWEASVRVSDELCYEEQQYLQRRKLHTRRALAKYLDVPEDDIHPDDIPVIGMCGSGGGLRAMVAGTSSYLSAQEAGLFDCATYTAGVSGSCWAQALYYSTLTHQNFGNLIKHLKARIGTHIAFPPPVLKLLTSAPTHTYLMAGGLEKYKGVEDAEFGIVDVYGLLLAARLMVPKGELDLNSANLKLSNQRKYVDTGKHPLPLYTAVRHEIPPEQQTADTEPTKKDITEVQEPKTEAWFQWFEFSPYEFYSEDFGAGIPTWAVGRSFENGHSKRRSAASLAGTEQPTYLPELRLSLLMGVWGSAFCATLAHYYKEIRPLVKGLTGFSGVDEMLEDRNDDMARLHPVDPAQIPNFALGMRDMLPERCPDSVCGTSGSKNLGADARNQDEDIEQTQGAKHIQLMDAGMSNNLPIYPLLRRNRAVDILIVFDSSADIRKENWLRVVDGYAQRRGVEGWPAGAGFPVDREDGPAAFREEHVADGMDGGRGASGGGEKEKGKGKETTAATTATPEKPPHGTLGACTIWRGPSTPSSAINAQEKEGLTLIYYPLLPHPSLPNLDPDMTPFLSTWNFIYTDDEIEQVVALARANFREGEDRVREAVRRSWERRRRERVRWEAGSVVSEAEWFVDGGA